MTPLIVGPCRSHSYRYVPAVGTSTPNVTVGPPGRSIASTQSRRIADDLTRTDARLAAKEKRLKAQFAAMETALQNSQTQQAWLTAQLAGLSASSG